MARYKRENINENLNLNVRGLSQSATLAINERSNELIKKGREVFKLGLGQSPFPVPSTVVEALKKNAHQKDYLPVKGLLPLREAIAGFNKRVNKLGCFTFPSSLRWLLNAISIVASETFTSTSAPIQYAAIKAFEENKEIDIYLPKTRAILKGIAKYMVNQLRNMHIKVPMPQGAFYLFLDFEFYRENFIRNGIYTSVEMCKKLLDETGVAILPGSDFGRQPEELTARLAYVDFDGKKAINALTDQKNGNNIDEEFIKKYCPKLVQAIFMIKEWLSKL